LAIWLILTVTVNFILTRYVGYLVRVGHIAVVSEAVTTGQIPEHQIAYGKEKVKEQFLTANAFFVINRLVDRAVKQLQGVLGSVVGLLGAVPGLGLLLSFGKMVVGIALKYIDDCCIGYIFYKKDQGAFKSATDGVVIYAQNWKKLLKSAFKTGMIVVLLTTLFFVVAWIVLGLLVHLLPTGHIGTFIAFVIGFLIAIVIKRAFVDSYMMVQMMVAYMEEAPTTVVSFDLYGKFSKMSRSFRRLFSKAEEEGPINAPPPVVQTTADVSEAPAPAAFCGSCGEANTGNAAFCGKCGAKL